MLICYKQTEEKEDTEKERAELTPGLWICQTKEVRTKILLDMGG